MRRKTYCAIRRSLFAAEESVFPRRANLEVIQRRVEKDVSPFFIGIAYFAHKSE